MAKVRKGGNRRYQALLWWPRNPGSARARDSVHADDRRTLGRSGSSAELDADGTPNAIVFEFRPHEDHQQGFEMIGSLSEIFSSYFQWRTMKERAVSKLEVDVVPGQMANLIPKTMKARCY
jgi:hypothetical protein